MEIIYTLGNIKQTCTNIWQQYNDRKVWAFYAEMGSGKTTFIHSLCEVLGVKSAISSPTYAIINEYKSEAAGVIFHMDWYRLKDENEALLAGVDDCLYSGNLCLVEWPQNAENLLPNECLKVNIEFIDTTTRRLSMQAR